MIKLINTEQEMDIRYEIYLKISHKISHKWEPWDDWVAELLFIVNARSVITQAGQDCVCN